MGLALPAGRSSRYNLVRCSRCGACIDSLAFSLECSLCKQCALHKVGATSCSWRGEPEQDICKLRPDTLAMLVWPFLVQLQLRAREPQRLLPMAEAEPPLRALAASGIYGGPLQGKPPQYGIAAAGARLHSCMPIVQLRCLSGRSQALHAQGPPRTLNC